MDTFFIIYLIVLTALFIGVFAFVDNIRRKGSIARALNMTLFLVTLPREAFASGPGQAQRPEKEIISTMEHLYSSFTNLHSKGWNKFVYGEPYISLEMAVHHIGEEIHFYVAVPKSYDQIFEKQVHGIYPMAELSRIKDYNIFNPNGVSVGAYLKLKENPILPIKTYQRLETDPLGALANSLSKLEKEGEGAAIQILIRPSHHT